MIKTILFTLTLAVIPGAHAACLQDSPEIGDIGPSSQLVCDLLEARFTQSDIAILDRKMHSRDTVAVIVAMNGQLQSLEYNLHGADWKLTEPHFVNSYRNRIGAIMQ